MYDAVISLGFAMEAAQSEGSSLLPNGSSIIAALRDIRFDGASGPVAFGPTLDRSTDSAVFLLVNLAFDAGIAQVASARPRSVPCRHPIPSHPNASHSTTRPVPLHSAPHSAHTALSHATPRYPLPTPYRPTSLHLTPSHPIPPSTKGPSPPRQIPTLHTTQPLTT